MIKKGTVCGLFTLIHYTIYLFWHIPNLTQKSFLQGDQTSGQAGTRSSLQQEPGGPARFPRDCQVLCPHHPTPTQPAEAVRLPPASAGPQNQRHADLVEERRLREGEGGATVENQEPRDVENPSHRQVK